VSSEVRIFSREETAYIQENLKKVHLFDGSSLEPEDPTDALGVARK
jgi:hypothetical protein